MSRPCTIVAVACNAAKLGARNGTHAVALALRKGLLPLPRERELQLVPQRAQSTRGLRH